MPPEMMAAMGLGGGGDELEMLQQMMGSMAPELGGGGGPGKAPKKAKSAGKKKGARCPCPIAVLRNIHTGIAMYGTFSTRYAYGHPG
jgi:hypothetical protein